MCAAHDSIVYSHLCDLLDLRSNNILDESTKKEIHKKKKIRKKIDI